MRTKLCRRFGLFSGAAVGLFLNFLQTPPCCTPSPLNLAQCSLYGVIVALTMVLLSAAFTCLVQHLPIKPVLMLAALIGIIVGGLLGPFAYTLPNPFVAMFLCAILGAILGWLICRALCGAHGVKWGAAR